MKDKEKQIEERLDRKTALRVLQDLSKRMSTTLDLFGEMSLFISRPSFEEVRKKYLDELAKDNVVLSKEEYNEYVELRNSEVAELVKENKVLGKQCLDWMKLYHKQLTKTKQASKEMTEKCIRLIKETYFTKEALCEFIAKQFGVEIKE